MSLTRLKFTPPIVLAVASICLAGTGSAQEKPRPQAAPNIDQVTDANFPILFDALQPPAVEPWKSIPWHISIVEAARQAEKEGKPLFMWQADGWPLGCG
jgi:hypothetical protein